MDLKLLFDKWGQKADKDYIKKQWLLSKWEVFEGIEWPAEKIDIMTKSIIDGLDLKPTASLIDLGCGGGWILNTLRGHVQTAVGLDFSLSMLDKARKAFPGQVYICGQIGNLPFKAETWDCALSYFVFLNFMEDGFVMKAILDIMRVLKRGGRVLIGQLPDMTRSKDYDQAKADYFEYCQANFTIGKSNRDICRAPQKLFDKKLLVNFLEDNQISYRFEPSFNPFYRPGQPEKVDWRFDLILSKK